MVTHKKEVSVLRLAVGAISDPLRVGESDIAIAVAVAFDVAIEEQSTICGGFEILHYTLGWCHITGEWTGIELAEGSD
jgi:hypothetical protein